ncbi:MAG TPA: hypothetical protein VID27_15355 [Blastocatellia bacterium]
MKKLLFTASWVILLVMSLAIIAVSGNSLRRAYFGKGDDLTPQVTLEKIREAGGEHGEEAVKAFRGRRATAATWALGWALMAIGLILVPYRTGHRWAWWTLLISVVVSQLLSLARYPLLDTLSGAGASGIILGIALLGLLAGVPRMFSRGEEES